MSDDTTAPFLFYATAQPLAPVLQEGNPYGDTYGALELAAQALCRDSDRTATWRLGNYGDRACGG